MPLLIEIDASNDRLPETITLAQGDMIALTHSKYVDDTRMPPTLSADIHQDGEVVESFGSFGNGAVSPERPSAIPTIPSPQTLLILAKSPGQAGVVLDASEGSRADRTTIILVVTEPRMDPSLN